MPIPIFNNTAYKVPINYLKKSKKELLENIDGCLGKLLLIILKYIYQKNMNIIDKNN